MLQRIKNRWLRIIAFLIVVVFGFFVAFHALKFLDRMASEYLGIHYETKTSTVVRVGQCFKADMVNPDRCRVELEDGKIMTVKRLVIEGEALTYTERVNRD